jgi:hypothetical protein
MSRTTVTVSHTVHVDRTPEQVSDYTQDYATRSDWDSTVKSAEVLSGDPRRVRVVMEGLGPLVIEYKLDRRGERTSAAFSDPATIDRSGNARRASRADNRRTAKVGRLAGSRILAGSSQMLGDGRPHDRTAPRVRFRTAAASGFTDSGRPD